MGVLVSYGEVKHLFKELESEQQNMVREGRVEGSWAPEEWLR